MSGIPRILHIGNPSNVASELRDALNRASGFECLVLETHNNRLRFDEDVRFSWDWAASATSRVGRHASYVLLLRSLLASADLLHMHTSGRTALAAQKWARAHRKPVVRHFHGEELRKGGVEEEVRHADAVLLSTPDLLGDLARITSRESFWIPVPRRFPQVRPKRPNRPVARIAHAYLSKASYASVFGTETIRDVAEKMNKMGIRVELDEISGVSHPEALARLREADIAIDKLRIGWYGAFAVECLAEGIPVLAGIRQDLLQMRPPVIATTEDGLLEALCRLSQDFEERERTAEALFQRARELHDSKLVGARVGAVYRDLLNR